LIFLPQFQESVTFSAYSDAEIRLILHARVGDQLFADNVLEYISKATAGMNGDIRKALEMASRAASHRLLQCTAGAQTSGCLVKMSNVIAANKDESANLKGRINGLPRLGKVILCVMTSLANGNVVETTVGILKKFVVECMEAGIDDQGLEMEDFTTMVETLVDAGILRASTRKSPGGKFILNGLESIAEVLKQPICLGSPLEEVDKLLVSELKRPYYEQLRNAAKHSKLPTC
jgi:Cdc6-like AAA superfamily ATPase